jgi:hypothetical protein
LRAAEESIDNGDRSNRALALLKWCDVIKRR